MRSTPADALRSQAGDLTLDLLSVTYMENSGFSDAIETADARKQSTRLVLRSVQTQPLNLLTVAGLDHVFEIQEAANT
jgi:anti-anti-sigma regulatory factor